MVVVGDELGVLRPRGGGLGVDRRAVAGDLDGVERAGGDAVDRAGGVRAAVERARGCAARGGSEGVGRDRAAAVRGGGGCGAEAVDPEHREDAEARERSLRGLGIREAARGSGAGFERGSRGEAAEGRTHRDWWWVTGRRSRVPRVRETGRGRGRTERRTPPSAEARRLAYRVGASASP